MFSLRLDSLQLRCLRLWASVAYLSLTFRRSRPPTAAAELKALGTREPHEQPPTPTPKARRPSTGYSACLVSASGCFGLAFNPSFKPSFRFARVPHRHQKPSSILPSFRSKRRPNYLGTICVWFDRAPAWSIIFPVCRGYFSSHILLGLLPWPTPSRLTLRSKPLRPSASAGRCAIKRRAAPFTYNVGRHE